MLGSGVRVGFRNRVRVGFRVGFGLDLIQGCPVRSHYLLFITTQVDTNESSSKANLADTYFTDS